MLTTTTLDIDNYLKEKKTLIDDYLENIFKTNNFKESEILREAIKYSLLNGGKRIRGILCLATSKCFNKNCSSDALNVACSIEMIHAMSLIHDDLPCMDNDDCRRGKPSCHKAFGEANAILAGDALLTLAFNLIIENTKEIADTKKLNVINTLAKAFTFGLVPGQILDLQCSNKTKENLDIDTIKKISKLKTAELIQASVLCGAILALDEKDKETASILEVLKSFAYKIGVAFQIIDDVLDLTGDTKTLGKTSGKDKKQNKATFPSLLGIENSKNMAYDLINSAKVELKKLHYKTDTLLSLSDYIFSRIN